MNKITLWSTAALLLLLGAAGVRGQCTCDMVDSVTYPGTLVIDCTNQGLTELPNGCLEMSEQTSELWMSYNLMTEVRSTSLIELTQLRTIHLDNNDLTFVDPTAFEFMRDLEVFKIDHNLELSLESTVFAGLVLLREISMIGTDQGTLPDVSVSPKLEKLDVRSSSITALPLDGFLHPELESQSFYFNFMGNKTPDIAGRTLMELPDNSQIFLDTDVLLWVMSYEEELELQSKPWDINIDLNYATRICEVDGLPGDLTICYE